jgi:nitroreductase
MTVTEAIRSRRSIRRFKPNVLVTDDQLNLLLEAAMLAPSACNSRPWEFIAIRSKSIFKQLQAAHPYAGMLATATLAIVVCGLPEAQSGISQGYFPQDCAAATENILLQAVELGLGACWCGVYPDPKRVSDFQRILGVSSVPFNVIALGAPDSDARQQGFYDSEKVKFL